ncbi:hypothetical protein GCM10027285_12320 [Oleiagrimonas citrea]|uniref:Uncharacterized protein n=1 Tax=Oleiagrimonas citrea TaxID=1665687 RepID=A0A846ZL02_9GAMM|nr:DUF6229 family protein [Oleiagrimonas citrea]NKZ38208.1 hypothetical protein [Oleiagrimonas citrea]
MSNAESIVSSWLQGSEIADGMANPAGSLNGMADAAMEKKDYGVLNTGLIRCDTLSTSTCFG